MDILSELNFMVMMMMMMAMMMIKFIATLQCEHGFNYWVSGKWIVHSTGVWCLIDTSSNPAETGHCITTVG